MSRFAIVRNRLLPSTTRDLPSNVGDFQAFSTVNLWFSSDGKEYPGTPETLNDPQMNINLDNGSEKVGNEKNSASITIPLQSRIGKFVRMELKPKATWLLLSEVTFVTGNLLPHYYTQNIAETNQTLDC